MEPLLLRVRLVPPSAARSAGNFAGVRAESGGLAEKGGKESDVDASEDEKKGCWI